MKTTVLFDSNNALWRLANTMPPLTTKGQPIEIVYGMLKLVHGVLEDFEPESALAVWDRHDPALVRTEIWPDYKKRRIEKRREELEEKRFKSVILQAKRTRHILEMLRVPQVLLKGVEADDILAIASRCIPGRKVIISADQDMLQLVNEDVDVWSPIKRILYTRDNFRKLTGLSPRQFLEMRILTGDPSDEIPGVAKGFGCVTAKSLLERYGDIETLFRSSVRKKVEKRGSRYALLYSDGAEEAIERNRSLMDLTGLESKTCLRVIDKALGSRKPLNKFKVLEYFREKEFRSLLDSFGTWIKPFEELNF